MAAEFGLVAVAAGVEAVEKGVAVEGELESEAVAGARQLQANAVWLKIEGPFGEPAVVQHWMSGQQREKSQNADWKGGWQQILAETESGETEVAGDDEDVEADSSAAEADSSAAEADSNAEAGIVIVAVAVRHVYWKLQQKLVREGSESAVLSLVELRSKSSTAIVQLIP